MFRTKCISIFNLLIPLLIKYWKYRKKSNEWFQSDFNFVVWFMKKHVVCCVLQDYRHGVIVKKIKCHSHNYYNKHFLCGKEKFEMRWSNKEVCLKQFAHSNTKNGLLNFLFTIKSNLGNNNSIYLRMRSHFQLLFLLEENISD